MPLRQSQNTRRAIAEAIVSMDEHWVALFGELGIGDSCYSDLLVNMWLCRSESLRKTDLYPFMPGISRRTAVKYVQEMIDVGLLDESGTEDDKRVRHVTLTPILSRRLERYFDQVYALFEAIEPTD